MSSSSSTEQIASPGTVAKKGVQKRLVTDDYKIACKDIALERKKAQQALSRLRNKQKLDSVAVHAAVDARVEHQHVALHYCAFEQEHRKLQRLRKKAHRLSPEELTQIMAFKGVEVSKSVDAKSSVSLGGAEVKKPEDDLPAAPNASDMAVEEEKEPTVTSED